MSTRERSNGAPALLGVGGDGDRLAARRAVARPGVTSPSGRICTAPASSSRESAVASFVWLSSVASCSRPGSTGPPAVLDRLQDGADLGQVDLPAAGEEAAQAEVLGAVEEHGLGGRAVAPGAPDLLVVGVERLGDLRVDDPADVRLVDAHAEGGRGDHDVEVVVHEPLLDVVAVAAAHAAVVGGRAQAVLAQPGGELLGRAPGRHVEDPGRRRGGDVLRAGRAACARRRGSAGRTGGCSAGRSRARAPPDRAARAARRSPRAPAAPPWR